MDRGGRVRAEGEPQGFAFGCSACGEHGTGGSLGVGARVSAGRAFRGLLL